MGPQGHKASLQASDSQSALYSPAYKQSTTLSTNLTTSSTTVPYGRRLSPTFSVLSTTRAPLLYEYYFRQPSSDHPQPCCQCYLPSPSATTTTTTRLNTSSTSKWPPP